MLLAIDIGNTNISFGLFNRRKLVRKFDIASIGFTSDKLRSRLGRKTDISEAMICSVVPKLTPTVENAVKKLLLIKPVVVGRDLKVPLKNLYRNPEQVGQDRLVNAYAAVRLYGSPLIAIDFGTAITFDVISRRKEYLGGMILPGLKMSLDALHSKTALLPEVNLSRPKEFIGRDTKNSMLSGIVYGVSALTDKITAMIRSRIGRNALVVGTGSSVKLVKKYCRAIDAVDEDLTLKGLDLISII